MKPRRRRLPFFAITLLAIEFLDELVFGAREAAWPLIRDDLGLTYVQIGLLLSVPGFLSTFIEPPLFILGDVWKRRILIVGGGVVFAAAAFLASAAGGFSWLLLAFVVFAPASGAFVGLSEATLMDTAPKRHEQLMARWTLAGSLGLVAGPLALGAVTALGFGWRVLYVAFGIIALGLVLIMLRIPFQTQTTSQLDGLQFREGLSAAWQALRNRTVLRWLVLLEFSDFMLDVLLGFLALYMVDVIGVSPALAGIAVAIWSGAGLLGDALLVPLLERVRGLVYLRYSAAVMFVLFTAFLSLPGVAIKLVLLALLGLFNAGWYAILAVCRRDKYFYNMNSPTGQNEQLIATKQA